MMRMLMLLATATLIICCSCNSQKVRERELVEMRRAAETEAEQKRTILRKTYPDIPFPWWCSGHTWEEKAGVVTIRFHGGKGRPEPYVELLKQGGWQLKRSEQNLERKQGSATYYVDCFTFAKHQKRAVLEHHAYSAGWGTFKLVLQEIGEHDKVTREKRTTKE